MNQESKSYGILAIGLTIFMMFMLGGCTKAVKIDNMNQLHNLLTSYPGEKNLIVGVILEEDSPQYMNVYDHRMLSDVARQLRHNYNRMYPSFSISSSESVNAILRLKLTSNLNWNWKNIFVNVPGSALLLPWLYGYKYDVNYYLHAKLENPSGIIFEDFVIPVKLKVRAFSLWGELPLLGLTQVVYDHDATPLIYDEAGVNISRHIAQELHHKILTFSGYCGAIEKCK